MQQRSSLKHAIQADRRFAAAFEQLGLIRAARNDFSRAVNDFGFAANLEPEVARHRVNLAMALNQLSRFQEAWQAIRSIVEREDSQPLALLTAAQALAGRGRRQEAAEMLERYLVLEPRDAVARDQLRKLRRLGDASSSSE